MGQRTSRLLLLCVGLALVGAAVSFATLQIHFQLDALGDKYTSFCNVNETVNCDRVLTSPFAKLFGLPVAGFATATYVVIAALFLAAWRGSVSAFQLATAGVVGSVAFSLYMLGISTLVLGTICLMCSSMYLVAALSALAAWFAARSLSGDKRINVFPATYTGVVAVSAALAIGAIAGATWPNEDTGPVADIEELRERVPEFYSWYMDRERVDPASLLRDGIEPLSPGVVTIVEFSDFQCGHCAHNHFLMKELHERHPDSVRILHRNFPLDVACNEALQQSVHRFACRAAEAAECASLQGKYEPMADLLFENQRQLFEANLFRLAGKAGLDAEAFASCMESHETMPTIRADTKLGTRLEITSTPTFFIEGRRISGSLPSEAQYDYALLIELTEKATGAQATPPQTSRAPTLSPASRATPHDLAFAQAPLTAPTCNGTVAGPGIVCDSGILPEPLHRAWLLSLVQRLLLYVSAPVPGTRVPGATETT